MPSWFLNQPRQAITEQATVAVRRKSLAKHHGGRGSGSDPWCENEVLKKVPVLICEMVEHKQMGDREKVSDLE